MTISGTTRALNREAQAATPDAVIQERLDELVTDILAPSIAVVNEILDKHTDRLVEAAKRYASYDRSDPFTIDRCCGHIRQGLCKAVEQSDGLPWPVANTTIKGDAGAPGHYDALVLTTMHDGQIELIHKNLRRP